MKEGVRDFYEFGDFMPIASPRKSSSATNATAVDHRRVGGYFSSPSALHYSQHSASRDGVASNSGGYAAKHFGYSTTRPPRQYAHRTGGVHPSTTMSSSSPALGYDGDTGGVTTGAPLPGTVRSTTTTSSVWPPPAGGSSGRGDSAAATAVSSTPPPRHRVTGEVGKDSRSRTPPPEPPPAPLLNTSHDVTTVLTSSQQLVTSTSTGTAVLRQQLPGAAQRGAAANTAAMRYSGEGGHRDHPPGQRPILRAGARTPSPNRVVLLDADTDEHMYGRAASARRLSPVPHVQERQSVSSVHRLHHDASSARSGSMSAVAERSGDGGGVGRDRFSGRPKRRQSSPHSGDVGGGNPTSSPLRNSLLGPAAGGSPQQGAAQQHLAQHHNYPTTLEHAWEKLCLAAQRDFTPADLRLVSCDTLRAIMEHYDIVAPEEVAHIEAQWALLQEDEDGAGVSLLFANVSTVRSHGGASKAPRSSLLAPSPSPSPTAALRLGVVMAQGGGGGVSGAPPPPPQQTGAAATMRSATAASMMHTRYGGAALSGIARVGSSGHLHPSTMTAAGTTRSHSLNSGGTLTVGMWTTSSERRRADSGALDTTLAPSLKPRCVLKGHRILLAQEAPCMSNPNLAVSPQGLERPRGIRSGIAPVSSKDQRQRVVPCLAPRDALQGGALREENDAVSPSSSRRISSSSLDEQRPHSSVRRSKINDGQLSSLA